MQKFPSIKHLKGKLDPIFFSGHVYVTEKVDGSQIRFGRYGDNIAVYSKYGEIDIDKPDHLFVNAVKYIKEIKHKLLPGYTYVGETLQHRGHGMLSYSRVPKNHIALFAVIDEDGNYFNDVRSHALHLGIDSVPILFEGSIISLATVERELQKESFLGGTKVEGVVIRTSHVGSAKTSPERFRIVKLVQENLREIAVASREANSEPIISKAEKKTRDLFNMYVTKARWRKAVQHLEEQGKLDFSIPDCSKEYARQLGMLMQEVCSDTFREEQENIKEALWKIWRRELTHQLTNGFDGWYREEIFRPRHEDLMKEKA